MGGLLLPVVRSGILKITAELLQSLAPSRKLPTSAHSTGQNSSKHHATGLGSQAQASRL